MPPIRTLLAELKRRRVFRVAGLYLVAAWLVVQVAATIFPIFELPAWAARLVLVLLLLGFPLALVLAWAFDLDVTAADPSPVLKAGEPGAPVSHDVKVVRAPLLRPVVGVLAAVLAFAGFWSAWARLGRVGAGAAQDAVAVFPFDVRAGRDAQYLREGMVSLLAARLDGAGGFRSADPQALLRSVPGRAPGVEAAGRLASRFGAGHYVLGSVVGGGSRVEISASLYRTGGRSGPVAAASAEGAADSVFGVVDRLAMQLLAARPGSGGTGGVRTAALTTGSLPAFKAYLEGERELRELRVGSAVEAFTRAVALDTTFSLAYSRLSVSALWHGDGALAVSAAAAAERRSDRLPPRYRELLAADAAFLRNGADAESRYRAVLARYPHDAETWYRLGEVLYHPTRDRARSGSEARTPFERALALDPGNELYLVHLRELACVENRVADLPRLNPRGAALDSLNPLVNGTMVALAGPAGERDRAVRRLAAAGDAEFFATVGFAAVCSPAEALSALLGAAGERAKSRGSRAWMSDLELSRGRPAAALAEIAPLRATDPVRELFTRSLDLTLPFVPHDRAGLRRARAELPRLDLSPPAADPRADSLRVLDRVLLEYCLGRVELSLGRPGEAEAHAAALRRASPASPRARGLAELLAGRLHAHALAATGKRVEALRVLDDLDARGLVGDMLPQAVAVNDDEERWLRAELLSAIGREQEALAWYLTLTEDWTSYRFLAPAELRIARIRERRGERREAVRSYRRFVTLWHDADPLLQPQVRDARARLRALER